MTETTDKTGGKETKRSLLSCPHFHGDSVALGGGTVTPVGRVSTSLWDSMSKRGVGGDHPAAATPCLAALYTSPGLQQVTTTNQPKD
ncbi:Hypothetical predicted protein [Scomber scombrus]|uniref:Uncharacterized protein n=1 Tax=Scomber scombrus TaxID=13677 RepID=A0AAV1PE88_SCOSC